MSSPELVPSCGDWWGAAVPNTGSNLSEAVADTEFETGRRLDIVHTYHRWTQDFPTPSEVALARSGHILLINWQPTDDEDKPIAWQAIADGSQDQVIEDEAVRLKAMGTPVMISFSHEPEANIDTEGSASQYVAAYQMVHNVVVEAGASNVVWVWDIEGIATSHWFSLYRQFWPGARLRRLDRLGPLQLRFLPWTAVAIVRRARYRRSIVGSSNNPSRDRPLMLAEYGTIGNIAGRTPSSAGTKERPLLCRHFPPSSQSSTSITPAHRQAATGLSNSSPAAAASFAALADSRAFRQTALLAPGGSAGPTAR